MTGARLVIEIGDLAQPAIAHRSSKRGHDQPAAEPTGKLDRRLRERGDVSGERALHRARRDRDILELVMPAGVRDRAVGRPQAADNLHSLLEDRLIVLERDPEGPVLLPVIAAAGGEIDAAATQQVEGRPLLGDADRMMQRQDRDRRGEANIPRSGRDIGEHEIGAGEHPQRAEMMLADPRRVEADLFGIDRFVDDVGDKPVGGSVVIPVTIVAEREIAEFH